MKKPRVEIWYELETRCNLHCGFCFNYWKDGTAEAPKRLSTSETLDCLSRLFTHVDCERLSISGGEPLLRENLYEILYFIKSHGVPVVLTTNGTLLDLWQVEKLVGAGVVTFQIPLHSTRCETHNYLSGIDCWKQTLQAFILTKEYGANVLAVFVATQRNLNDFCGVLEVCSTLGIKEIIFNRFIPSGRGSLNRESLGIPSEESLVQALIDANNVANRKNLVIHLGVPIELPDEVKTQLERVTFASCPVGVGQTRWTIDAAGNIRRCNHSGTTIGNILGNGLNSLLEDVKQDVYVGKNQATVKCCQFLRPEQLYQISVR